jgi:quercetin dioxygenase-like cupin family protein
MKKDKNDITDLTHKSHSNVMRHRAAPIVSEKTKPHVMVEIIEYKPHAVITESVIKRTIGNITVAAYDRGQEAEERTSPFDTFVQVIAGEAAVIIDEERYLLKFGNGVVIPAYAPYCFIANDEFKMISTVIKNGDED